MSEDDTKHGVQWGYLDTIHVLYKDMLFDYKNWVLSLQGRSNKIHQTKLLITSLSSFYLSVMYKFNSYLENKEIQNIVPKDYDDMMFWNGNIDRKKIEKLRNMVKEISKWSQKEGVFKTLVKNENPAFEGDEDW